MSVIKSYIQKIVFKWAAKVASFYFRLLIHFGEMGAMQEKFLDIHEEEQERVSKALNRKRGYGLINLYLVQSKLFLKGSMNCFY